MCLVKHMNNGGTPSWSVGKHIIPSQFCVVLLSAFFQKKQKT